MGLLYGHALLISLLAVLELAYAHLGETLLYLLYHNIGTCNRSFIEIFVRFRKTSTECTFRNAVLAWFGLHAQISCHHAVSW